MRQDAGTKELGTFEVSSGELRVTDPCYDPGTWCAGTIRAKDGTWTAELRHSDEGSWGKRVAELVVRHEDHAGAEPNRLTGIDAGVDSGQCGFFDAAKYLQHQGGEYGDLSTFYGQACAATATEGGGIVMGFGAVSSSGYGDGSYEVYVHEVDGLAVAARVVFISDDEDDLGEDELDDGSDEEEGD